VFHFQISEISTRLIKDIPKIRIGIINHGDYCDGKPIDVCDLTSDIKRLCNFVTQTALTGGGDSPEVLSSHFSLSLSSLSLSLSLSLSIRYSSSLSMFSLPIFFSSRPTNSVCRSLRGRSRGPMTPRRRL
jgi:hypothetical protein